MSNGTKWSMGAKRPYKIDPLSVSKELISYPYSRMKFITIKDSRLDSKISKIGKAYDYLKRFSQKIWVVMSPKGGTHFHALILLKEKHKMSFKKGVHIDVKDVGGERPAWDPESDKDKLDEAAELYQLALDHTGDVSHAIELYEQHLAPPPKEYQRAVRKLAKTKKGKHICDIVQYLNKNLLENTGPLCMYEHYIIRI